MKNLTDDDLIQIYDLQEKYAEKVIDFVRHGEESEVLQFLQIMPELNCSENWDKEPKIYRKEEFAAEMSWEKTPQGRFIYKDLFSKWKGTDNLREIFDEKYIWGYAVAQPEVLSVFSGNKEIALKKYSTEQYEKLREKIPQKLQNKIKNLLMNYPQDIQEKAMCTEVYGYVETFHSSKLKKYRDEHMTEFEMLSYVTQGEKSDTITDAYDLQVGLKIYHSELKNQDLTETIRAFLYDRQVFEWVYGEKSAELLSNAEEEVLKLAGRYNFVDTEEKLPLLENHKICMYGGVEQKLKIPYQEDPFCVSNKDFEKILDALAEKYEREGFSRKYYPSRKENQEYAHQSYKVVGRYKTENDTELQPQWNIVFDDGKIITAKADEIISSEINERFYGEQVENFGKRPLEKVLVNDSGKMNLSEGQEKISAIIRQLQKNGESTEKIKNFLEVERKNLSKAR
ncbi:MAG: hypothetical protein IK062_06600 [Selenomonadaceae bacterium]|nr:hypothetical protein [Selenomonadaceae bacterium]